MKYFITCIFVSLLLMYFPRTYSMGIEQSLRIAVGIYQMDDQQQAAILVNRNDNQSWKLTSPFLANKDIFYAGLMAVDCSEKICAAVGWYDLITDTLEQGAILSSSDQGETWKLTAPFINMPDFNYAYLPSVKCKESQCIVVGEYKKKEGNQGVIIATHDKGDTWETKFPFEKELHSARSTLTAIDCTDAVCVAVGQFFKNKDDEYYNQMIILVSHDFGMTWEKHLPLTDLPKIDRTYLYAVSCAENSCMVAGCYNDSNGEHSVMLVTNDAGKNWHQSSPFAAIPNLKESKIFTINCQKNKCFATGSYKTVDSESQIYSIHVSKDNGNSWTLATPLSSIKNVISTSMGKIACASDTCIAVGSYQTNQQKNGVILLSQDDGITWDYYLPFDSVPNVQHSSLSTVYCIKSYCISIGDYYGGETKNLKNHAAVFISKNNGKNWEFTDPLDNLINYEFASFYDVTVSKKT